MLLLAAVLIGPGTPRLEAARKQKDPNVIRTLNKALEYLKREQRRQGYWEARGGQYRVAMTALAANALLAEGSTATTGKYRDEVAQAVLELLGGSSSGRVLELMGAGTQRDVDKGFEMKVKDTKGTNQ